MPKIWILLSIIAVSLHAASIAACTSFGVKTEDGYAFYARTMEGEVDFKSTISIVPKATAYIGTLPDGTQKGMIWKTKYGLVGMNYFGLPIIIDGINEKGLAAGTLLFPGFAKYQTFNQTKVSNTIAEYEVVTWILSNFANVNEVKRAIKNIYVCQGPIDKTGLLELHFTVHDANGDRLVIEYVNGELKLYDNPIGVMTNSPPFDWHLINLRNYINISATNVRPFEIEGIKETGLGQGTGMLGLPGDYTPPSRFVRMAALVSSALPVAGADAGLNLAMTIINNVDIAKGSIREKTDKKIFYDSTYWTIVSDLGRKRFYFRTYHNKNWCFVDVMKSLANAKSIMTIKTEMPADYKDITKTAQEYVKLPNEGFPKPQ